MRPTHPGALRSLQRGLARRDDLLVARTRPDELAVWWSDGSASGQEVERALAAGATDVVSISGEAFAGPDALRRAWITAQDAWSVAQVGTDLYERRDVALVALLCGLRDDPVSAPWRRLVAADPHGELRVTLRAWFDQDMSPQRCAAALHVHRNTLSARLHRIEQVTELELGRVPSLLRLYLGPLLVSDPTP